MFLQSKSTPIHELFHAVGSWHQQSRPDRDDHVNILWDNIEDGKESNFNIHEDALTFGSAYTYRSVMHYGAYVSISKNSYSLLVITFGEHHGSLLFHDCH